MASISSAPQVCPSCRRCRRRRSGSPCSSGLAPPAPTRGIWERSPCDGVQVSWDLHNWLFPPREPPPADASTHAHAHAVLVFRFDLASGGGEEREADLGKDPSSPDKAARRNTGVWGGGYLARWGQRDWSETGSNGERRKDRG